jgi:hypothetical protein
VPCRQRLTSSEWQKLRTSEVVRANKDAKAKRHYQTHGHLKTADLSDDLQIRQTIDDAEGADAL